MKTNSSGIRKLFRDYVLQRNDVTMWELASVAKELGYYFIDSKEEDGVMKLRGLKSAHDSNAVTIASFSPEFDNVRTIW